MIKMEQDRVQAIKEAFQIAFHMLQERLVLTPYERPQEPLAVGFEEIDPEAETAESFQITELLEYQETHFIKRIYGVEEVSFDVFAQFVDDFKFKRIPERPLIVKEVRAQLWRDGAWRDCSLMLTIDRNILVVDGHDVQRMPIVVMRAYAGCCAMKVEGHEMSLFE